MFSTNKKNLIHDPSEQQFAMASKKKLTINNYPKKSLHRCKNGNIFLMSKKFISVIGLFANKTEKITQNKSSGLKKYILKPRIDPLKL